MKKIILTVIFTILLSQFSIAQTISFDIDNSSIIWTGKNIVNKSHYGSLSFVEAKIEFDNSDNITGFFKVDLNSINVLDLEGDWKKNLEGHLKSDDFFSVDAHPTALLSIQESQLISEGKWNVTANLTIKGITHPVDFEMSRSEQGWSANLVFDRSKYDVRFRSGTFFENLGDKLIYNEIELAINLTTI